MAFCYLCRQDHRKRTNVDLETACTNSEEKLRAHSLLIRAIPVAYFTQFSSPQLVRSVREDTRAKRPELQFCFVFDM